MSQVLQQDNHIGCLAAQQCSGYPHIKTVPGSNLLEHLHVLLMPVWATLSTLASSHSPTKRCFLSNWRC